MMHYNSRLYKLILITLNHIVIVIFLMFKTNLLTIDLLIVDTYCIYRFIAIVKPDHLPIIVNSEMIFIIIYS